MQDSEKDTDVYNGLLDSEGEGEGGMIWENGILTCILSCESILISRFWNIFTIIIQNSLSGRFPISSYFVWFGGHLSCSFTCWVFLCLFILFILLCLGWPFCILAVCVVLFIVKFPGCGWGCTGGLSKFLG